MIEGLSLKLLRAICFSPKSFYFFFNRIARYAQSKESWNLFGRIAIKRAKSNAKALAVPSVSNIDEVNICKSLAKHFLEIAFKHFGHYWVLLLKDVENSIILLVIIAIFENKRK